MDTIALTAASGLQARLQSLDMLANNLANSATTGFKADREFYSLFGQQMNQNLPMVDKRWTDFTQGTLQPTGNPLDLALTGSGFFVVNGPKGPLYTRNGSFRLSPQGVVTTAEGYPLSAIGGGNIKANSQNPIQVSSDGTVSQDGQALGQLQLVDFKDPRALNKIGNSYFQAIPTPAGSAPSPTGIVNATVEQGKLEGSNVVAAESTVGLVGLLRHCEMLQKAISMSTDMGKKAIEQIAHVGG